MMNIPPSKLSLIAVTVLGLYTFNPIVACSSQTGIFTAKSAQLSDINSLTAPRQFTLAQPGSPNGVVSKQLRSFEQSPLQSTGYMVKKGEVLVIDLEYPADVKPTVELFVSQPDDRTYKFSHAYRKPLARGENIITSEKGGIVYFALFSNPVKGDIKVNLESGGEPFPRYSLGVNRDQDWTSMLDAYPDSPYVELLSNKVMLTLRKDKAIQFIPSTGPDTMLKDWDNIIGLAEKQYGLTEENTTSVNQKIAHRFHWVDGISLPGVDNPDGCTGYMNAWTWRLQTCSDEAIGDVVNHKTLTTNAWGAWHELGHQFQMKPMTWDGLTEVTVNLTSLYMQRSFGLASRLETSGEWDKKIFPYLKQSNKDFNSQGVFTKLGMFWQLDLTFGNDFYSRLGKLYRELPTAQQPTTSVQKIQKFILETSRVAGYDLTPFFKQWGLNPSTETLNTISQLSLFPLLDPIWENRDSNISYDYSNREETMPVADAGKDIEAVATNNWAFAYKLDGGHSKNAVNYRWTLVQGGDKFKLRKDSTSRNAQEVSSVSAEAIVPVKTTGEAIYQLTVTSNGIDTATDTVKVTVVPPKVEILGNHTIMQGNESAYLAQTNIPKADGFQWQVMHAGERVTHGVSVVGNKLVLNSAEITPGEYDIHVTATGSTGDRRAVADFSVTVNASEPVEPQWEANKIYSSPCTKVSWQGSIWMNGWWTQGNKPGADGDWGVWRKMTANNNHSQCK
ncbi:M60 family metallopeptidase [Enterobacter cloacae subsp. cloacae]|uniref:M60 family metallopeptidase n=1 Tax=Enterobacter cloacae TaxID=550 RepID=UPI001C5A77CA|nr:M60 family metallopeptidase [Enterobacter cloacae]MBW4201861.1 M60 family metallopeptidase [Enterobacter cloacae subsp. cloacae]